MHVQIQSNAYTKIQMYERRLYYKWPHLMEIWMIILPLEFCIFHNYHYPFHKGESSCNRVFSVLISIPLVSLSTVSLLCFVCRPLHGLFTYFIVFIFYAFIGITLLSVCNMFPYHFVLNFTNLCCFCFHIFPHFLVSVFISSTSCVNIS
jgi:hypothetical protein